MTWAVALNVAAAACGMAGSVCLYRGSYSLDKPATWTSQEMVAEIEARNKWRLRMQHSGMGFLFVAFALQCAAQFVPA